MDFEVVHAFPRVGPAELYDRYRASAVELGRRLPNVARIDVLDSRGDRRLSRWFARADVPQPLRRLAAGQDLSWHEEVRFDDARKRAEARIHRPGERILQANVEYSFEAHGDGALLRVQGNVKIQLPFVGGPAERLVVSLIRENFGEFARSLEARAPAPAPVASPAAPAPPTPHVPVGPALRLDPAVALAAALPLPSGPGG